MTGASVLITSSALVPPATGATRRWPAARVVRSLWEVRGVLERLAQEEGLESGSPGRSLDLLGHSTAAGRLLRLGDTVVDMCDPRVAAFFAELARDDVLDRVGIDAVRLLGCETAVEPAGRLTIRLMARALGRRVYGARRPILRVHYDEHGLTPAFAPRLLVESGALARIV